MACSIEYKVQEHLEDTGIVRNGRKGELLLNTSNENFALENARLGARLSALYGVKGIPLFLTGQEVELNPDVFSSIQSIVDDNSEEEFSEEMQQELVERLDSSTRVLADKLGVKYKIVKNVRDRQGKKEDANAVADLLTRTIDVALGQEKEFDEEVTHMFTIAMKEMDDPLYASIRGRIMDTPEYADVVKEYGELDTYTDEMLIDEAISHVILERMRNPELMDREGRWWNRAWKFIQKVFNVYENPETEAAYTLMKKDLSAYKQALAGTESTARFFSLGGTRDNIREALLKEHENLRIGTEGIDFNRDALGGNVKNLEILEGEDGVITRYVRTDEDGNEQVVNFRVTDASTLAFVKSVGSLEKATKIWKRPKTQRAKEAGVTLHVAGQKMIMDVGRRTKGVTVINQDGIPENGKAAIAKEAGLEPKMGDILEAEMINIVNSARELQKEIDENEDVELITEVRIYDPETDTAGTIDILFLFSDGTAAMYDFKFISPKSEDTKGKGQLKRIVVDPFRGPKGLAYDNQLSSYSNTLVHVYGVNQIRRSRIIPGHVDFRWESDKPTTINTFRMGEKYGQFMKQIPVASELSGFEELDKMINTMWTRLEELEKQKSTATVRKEMDMIRRTVQELLLKSDFSSVLGQINSTVDLINSNIEIDDSTDENYMNWDEMRHAIEVLSMYDGIKAATDEMIKSLPEDQQEKAKENITKASETVSSALIKVQEKAKKRLADSSKFTLSELAVSTDNLDFFVPMAEINNPYFKEVYHRVMVATDRAKTATERLRRKWVEKDEALGEWAKGRGLSKTDAYDMLLREHNDQLKLITTFSSEFREKRDKILEEARTSKSATKKSAAQKYMKEHYVIRDGAKKEFKEFEAKMKKRYLLEFGNETDEGYKASMDWFHNTFNVWDRSAAWTSSSFYKYLEVNEKVADQKGLWSDEYAILRQDENEPLMDYYNSWKDQMREFNQMVDEHSITPDMIPSLRAGWMDRGLSKDLTVDMLLRPWSIQMEEDDRSGGEMAKVIPLPGMNAARDFKGKANTKLVSKDLTRVMYHFASSVYNNVEKSNIESEVLLLRRMMSESQELVGEVNKLGLRKSGKVKPGEMTTGTLQKMDMFINYYLYGHTLAHGDKTLFNVGTKSVTANKVAKTLNSYYGMMKIGLPVRIALGTRVAGAIFSRIEGIGGVHYTNDHLNQATRMFYTDRKKYMAAADYFDIHQEGEMMHRSRKMRAKWIDRWADESMLFEPLTMVDRFLDRKIGISMMLNHGIDKDGNLKRLAELPEGTKNILEYMNIKDGKVTNELPAMARMDLRKRIQYKAKDVKGDQGDENVILAHMNIGAQLLGKFKWWMPGTIKARMGSIAYHSVLDELTEGRFRGAWTSMGAEVDALEEDKGLHMLGKQMLARLKRGTMELLRLRTYRITEASRKKNWALNKKWTEADERRYQADRKRLRKELAHIRKNATDSALKNITEEQFFAMREASVLRTFAEARSVLTLLLMSLVAGMRDDEGEELYAKNWASRRLMDILGKILLETGFYLNPMEMLKFNRSFIPMLGLIGDADKWFDNTIQESARALGILKKDNRDRTPLGYYSLTFVPGMSQLRRIVEMYPQDKKVVYD